MDSNREQPFITEDPTYPDIPHPQVPSPYQPTSNQANTNSNQGPNEIHHHGPLLQNSSDQQAPNNNHKHNYVPPHQGPYDYQGPYGNQGPYQPQPYPQYNQNQGYQPYNQNQSRPPYTQNQGYQPGQGQMPPPPPMVARTDVVISLPNYIRPIHPRYGVIMEQCRMPCPICSFVGNDLISVEPGCAAISWAICLYILTGVFCFWVPLVMNQCKDVHIRCSRCMHLKFVVQKNCC